MDRIYLKIYERFQCIAGDCPSTCCAGWNIIIDEKSVKRYQQLSDLKLREDIEQHMERHGEQWRFVNQKNGRCSMLDEDGLCRIQRNLEEKDLCITCRKYPRLTRECDEILWMSMAASCPVVAEYLWDDKIEWCVKRLASSAGMPEKTDWMKQSFFFDISSILENWRKDIKEIVDNQKSEFSNKMLLDSFHVMWDVMEIALEILLDSPELVYPEGGFDYFEKENLSVEQILHDMKKFREKVGAAFFFFCNNYIIYRAAGLFFISGEKRRECVYLQILVELSIVGILLFSRFDKEKKLQKAEIVDAIHWTYRFAAHGRKRQEQLRQKLDRACFCSENMLQLLAVFVKN